MLERIAKRLQAFAEKDGRGYPDWALRYVPLVRGLNRRQALASRVLEIGANENGLGRFAKVRVIALDVVPAHVGAARDGHGAIPVVGDAGALPFASESMGLCACVETFEHLNPRARGLATSEIARVLQPQGTAVVTFPSGPHSERAEAEIREAYHRLTGGKLSWLEEHAEEGLPVPGDIARGFSDRMGGTHRVTETKNGSLWVWRWMWHVLICGWPGRGNALFQALLLMVTPVLCRLHFGKCYRTILWVDPKATDSELR